VYHYKYTGLNPSASLAESVLDNIVTLEKAFHANSISFVKGRVWSAGGSVSQNQMIFQKTLTGTGSTTSFAADRERAFLVAWPAGFDSRGKPVFLRKWWHTFGSMGGVTPSANVMQNISGFSTTERTAIANAASSFEPLQVNAQSMSLCSANGRGTTGSPIAHRYWEHHQLGDQWRS
jgi:hypothetical protein